MSKLDFVHLHVHSHYSLLDGLGKIDQLVNKSVELGMPALALTDHGVMYGAIDFYLACRASGIKPIVGQEAYVAPRTINDKSSGIDTRPYHLVLLAKNMAGYKNLIKLTSIAHMEGYYYKPRIDQDMLSRHSEGLIASSACLASQTSRLILDKDFEGLRQTVKTYQEIFGKDNYYLELQSHPAIAEQQVVNQHISDLAQKTGLPLIATNDTHYVNSQDHDIHDILVCIQTGKLVSDDNRMLYTGDFSLKSAQEMNEAFPGQPEALANTLKIADMVNLEIPLNQELLPKFPLPDDETEESLLRKWCEEGLRRRYPKITPEIRERVEFEFSTVSKSGFSGYFLIVADLINFARSQGVMVGPGRGSAVGSVVSYALGITNVDPLKYNLLFERFLNPDRISMPDIDIDFEDLRRNEVINYVVEKYGADHVAGIITFGTIMARAAVRDVGRVLGTPYTRVDTIAKLIPIPIQGRHVPLAKSIQETPELKAVYDSDPEAKQLLDTAAKLEGTVRHASQHACAIVISKEPLDQYVAVQAAQGGDVHQITQYSMGPIEKIGLLKMDFLGLANLSIMRRATEIIEAAYQTKIDLDNLPLDDLKTFELLSKAETTGIFQLESAGMKRYIRELKPDRFEDIIAMVALYRPGPIQWIQSFINRKHGLEPVEYLHPLAENALRDTYGIPVYQEQVMLMSKEMCGFTGSEADTLRKAIGKKDPKLMKQMRDKFVSGAMNNGVAKAKAEEIFRQLEDFAAYCFNKSHATCYALIAYQTAYLKAHFPDCFMAALMTSDLNDIDRISIEISESERLGLTVMPPNINESFADFAVVPNKKAIRFGLSAIKNVGQSVGRSIVTERKKNGLYKNLEDFLNRCSQIVNKKVLESLVKVGVLDGFGQRSHLFAGLELLVKYAGSANKNNSASQTALFDDPTQKQMTPTIILPTVAPEPKLYLTWEKELLGLYLSDHPLKEYAQALAKLATPSSEVTSERVNQTVRIGGLVQEVKKITTKNGQTMAFVKIEDTSGTLEAVVFPNSFAEYKDLWQNDQALLIQGKINDKDGTPKILADRVWKLDDAIASPPPPFSNSSARNGYSPAKKTEETPKPTAQSFLVELPSTTPKPVLEQLKSVLMNHPGSSKVELRFTNNGASRSVATKLAVSPSPKLKEEVAQLLAGTRI